MRTIHIGIGHDNHLMVSQSADIIIFLADARSQGRHHDLDFFILQHLVEAGLFNI